jgi:hypothetical protein
MENPISINVRAGMEVLVNIEIPERSTASQSFILTTTCVDAARLPRRIAVVATVIESVATRLNRIEDLLIEMRGVLVFHLKRTAALHKQLDILLKRIAVGS